MEKLPNYDLWKTAEPPESQIMYNCDYCDHPAGELIEFYGECMCVPCFELHTDICKMCRERDYEDHIVGGVCEVCREGIAKEENEKHKKN